MMPAFQPRKLIPGVVLPVLILALLTTLASAQQSQTCDYQDAYNCQNDCNCGWCLDDAFPSRGVCQMYGSSCNLTTTQVSRTPSTGTYCCDGQPCANGQNQCSIITDSLTCTTKHGCNCAFCASSGTCQIDDGHSQQANCPYYQRCSDRIGPNTAQCGAQTDPQSCRCNTNSQCGFCLDTPNPAIFGPTNEYGCRLAYGSSNGVIGVDGNGNTVPPQSLGPQYGGCKNWDYGLTNSDGSSACQTVSCDGLEEGFCQCVGTHCGWCESLVTGVSAGSGGSQYHGACQSGDIIGPSYVNGNPAQTKNVCSGGWKYGSGPNTTLESCADYLLDEEAARIAALNAAEKQDLFLLAACGTFMLFCLMYFHYYHSRNRAETGHSLREPFPDSTPEQLQERSCAKLVRFIMLRHPITMLLYAGKRDGFGTGRRFFCLFLAVSIQLGITFVVLSANLNAWIATVLSAAASFIYEKPIIYLVRYTARLKCCDGCCNCLAACGSYICLCICIIQIPLLFILYYVLIINSGKSKVYFRFQQLIVSWAASIVLGWVAQVPQWGCCLICRPEQSTKEINHYSREYEGYGDIKEGETKKYGQHGVREVPKEVISPHGTVQAGMVTKPMVYTPVATQMAPVVYIAQPQPIFSPPSQHGAQQQHHQAVQLQQQQQLAMQPHAGQHLAMQPHPQQTSVAPHGHPQAHAQHHPHSQSQGVQMTPQMMAQQQQHAAAHHQHTHSVPVATHTPLGPPPAYQPGPQSVQPQQQLQMLPPLQPLPGAQPLAAQHRPTQSGQLQQLPPPAFQPPQQQPQQLHAQPQPHALAAPQQSAHHQRTPSAGAQPQPQPQMHAPAQPQQLAAPAPGHQRTPSGGAGGHQRVPSGQMQMQQPHPPQQSQPQQPQQLAAPAPGHHRTPSGGQPQPQQLAAPAPGHQRTPSGGQPQQQPLQPHPPGTPQQLAAPAVVSVGGHQRTPSGGVVAAAAAVAVAAPVATPQHHHTPSSHAVAAPEVHSGAALTVTVLPPAPVAAGEHAAAAPAPLPVAAPALSGDVSAAAAGISLGLATAADVHSGRDVASSISAAISIGAASAAAVAPEAAAAAHPPAAHPPATN